jgi:hypothetical protein
VTPATLCALLALTLAQDPQMAPAGLAARIDQVVQVVDGRWVLVAASGSDEDRVHQWRRVNDIMTLQARQFATAQEAERHVKALVAELAVRPDESLKVGSFAVRIEWGDGRSSVYLATGRTAIVISAPSAELSKRLSRQAVLEFADRQRISASR